MINSKAFLALPPNRPIEIFGHWRKKISYFKFLIMLSTAVKRFVSQPLKYSADAARDFAAAALLAEQSSFSTPGCLVYTPQTFRLALEPGFSDKNH